MFDAHNQFEEIGHKDFQFLCIIYNKFCDLQKQ